MDQIYLFRIVINVDCRSITAVKAESEDAALRELNSIFTDKVDKNYTITESKCLTKGSLEEAFIMDLLSRGGAK